ncbi:hypothetical protein [Jatrophihabitans fulvus]
MAYVPHGTYRRTEAERTDQEVSWQRSDRAFFAAGACHILAYTFLERPEAEGFGVVGLHRPGAPYLEHVYATDGEWAFDYCGWTREAELIEATLEFETATDPGHRFERVEIDGSLDVLCMTYRHRSPVEYLHDPRPRARAFIDTLLTDAG